MIELPVADPWFVCEPMADGVTLITEPHVHHLLRCNIWHVRGRDADLVVDTSLGLAPLRRLIGRDRDDEILAVATHTHFDHIGGLSEFPRRAAHRAEAGILDAPFWLTLESEPFGEAVLAPYREAGYEIPELLLDATPPGGLASMTFERDPVPVTRVLDEGDIVDLGDRSFEVFHLPGHSPGSIGLWEESTGILLSGDAVYDGPLLDGLDDSDVDDYVATMQRLRELPAQVVYAGHEGTFDRERLVEFCDRYLRLRG
jgi:glyoxylase-like metal-dependent hydrolase (beta-lactamase superfamily II)